MGAYKICHAAFNCIYDNIPAGMFPDPGHKDLSILAVQYQSFLTDKGDERR
jgi:hypothetical protein